MKHIDPKRHHTDPTDPMTARTFDATVEPAGNATGVTVPADIVAELGGGRPLVVISINGHSWRSRIATKNGRSLIGISRANRTAAKIELGQHIDVTLELDTEPRTVDVPNDVAEALDVGPISPGRLRSPPLRPPPQTHQRHRRRQDRRHPPTSHRQAGHNARLNPQTRPELRVGTVMSWCRPEVRVS